MQHIAPWYRPEDYSRIREIMDDGAKMPVTFEKWEEAAERQFAKPIAEGMNIKRYC